MKSIEYRAVFTEGEDEFTTVLARTINSGFPKALRAFRLPLGNGRERELARVEFWQVKS